MQEIRHKTKKSAHFVKFNLTRISLILIIFTPYADITDVVAVNSC